MNVQELLNLRKQIDTTLTQRRGDLEKQLRELGALTDGARVGGGRRGVSALKGKKVALALDEVAERLIRPVQDRFLPVHSSEGRLSSARRDAERSNLA